MADYPTVPQVIGSKPTDSDGTVMERAVSGKARLRSYYTITERTFVLVHDCDGPDKDSIISHFAAHRTIGFNMTFDGDDVVYGVQYVGPPQETPIAGTDRWRVTTRLVVT